MATKGTQSNALTAIESYLEGVRVAEAAAASLSVQPQQYSPLEIYDYARSVGYNPGAEWKFNSQKSSPKVGTYSRVNERRYFACRAWGMKPLTIHELYIEGVRVGGPRLVAGKEETPEARQKTTDVFRTGSLWIVDESDATKNPNGLTYNPGNYDPYLLITNATGNINFNIRFDDRYDAVGYLGLSIINPGNKLFEFKAPGSYAKKIVQFV